jgi:hypothetical protein
MIADFVDATIFSSSKLLSNNINSNLDQADIAPGKEVFLNRDYLDVATSDNKSNNNSFENSIDKKLNEFFKKL